VQNSPREQRAQDRFHAHAAAAPDALPCEEQRRNQQRNGERRQRKMRAEREQQLADLSKNETDAGREIQRGLLS
jgi:hypothetical protein